MQTTLRQGSYTRSWAGSEAIVDGIRPRFYFEAVLDEVARAKEGRPIFRQEEFVELFMPGNPYTVPVFKVTDEHRQRWPSHYEAFRKGEEAPVEGTPLEEWPAVNRAQVRELKAIDIHTIEDVANLSDLVTQRIMGLQGLRNIARAFLDDAAAMALTSQLTKENDDLKARIAALENQVNELGNITRQQHSELMGMKNAPNPIATAIPGLGDPLQVVAQQNTSMSRTPPESSLAQFNEAERLRHGAQRIRPSMPTEGKKDGISH